MFLNTATNLTRIFLQGAECTHEYPSVHLTAKAPYSSSIGDLCRQTVDSFEERNTMQYICTGSKMNIERSQGSMHEHNDITADLNVNVNAFERRLAERASW